MFSGVLAKERNLSLGRIAFDVVQMILDLNQRKFPVSLEESRLIEIEIQLELGAVDQFCHGSPNNDSFVEDLLLFVKAFQLTAVATLTSVRFTDVYTIFHAQRIFRPCKATKNSFFAPCFTLGKNNEKLSNNCFREWVPKSGLSTCLRGLIIPCST